MSAQAAGLAATALLVANEWSSGDGSTLWGMVNGSSTNTQANHAALIRLGAMMAGVVVLSVAAGQSSPWPTLVTVLLVGLWAVWAIHTFTGSKAKQPVNVTGTGSTPAGSKGGSTS